MYNHLLDTFITVSDCGSFTKASRELYISPTAVMKQINQLEEHLDLRLIERTTGGIRLTEAGKIIYRDSLMMKDFSRRAINEARATLYTDTTTFCVGTSLLNPAKPFMDIWFLLSAQFPDYNLHLVPFSDDKDGIMQVMEDVGSRFDFLIGVCDSHTWMDIVNFCPLGSFRLEVAVSRDHPLAHKEILTAEDLNGQTIVTAKRGESVSADAVKDYLAENCTNVIVEAEQCYYDLSTLNDVAAGNKVMITVEAWKGIHPGLVNIPVDWDFTIPYGLIYSKKAPDDVLRFVKEAQKLSKEGKI